MLYSKDGGRKIVSSRPAWSSKWDLITKKENPKILPRDKRLTQMKTCAMVLSKNMQNHNTKLIYNMILLKSIF
jgi:hypothetical protein